MHSAQLWLCGALILCCSSASPCQEKIAAIAESHTIVVLFTPGGHWRGLGSQLKRPIGKSEMLSNGAAFDGDELIGDLSHSRYLAVRVPPGPHTFSANQTSRHPSRKEALTLDLKAGSITYLAITTTSMNYTWNFMWPTSHISLATCAEFIDDHAKHKSESIQEAHIADAYLANRESSKAIFTCTP